MNINWTERYENTWVKKNYEDTNRLIRKYEGKGILCCLWPKPFLVDLNGMDGVVTSRNTVMAEFGKFEQIFESGMNGLFLFKPKEGAEIPEELQEQREWGIGVAQIHLDDGVVKVPWAEREITLLDVDLDLSESNLMTAINKELEESNAGVVIWAMDPVHDLEKRKQAMYPGEKLPYMKNDQTSAPVTGYAFYTGSGTNYLVYAGILGYKTSAESLWASVVTAKGHVWIKAYSLFPASKMKTVSQPVKQFNRTHVAILANSAIRGGWRPDDSFAYILTFDLENPKADLQGKIQDKFEEIFPFPIRPKWIPVIWKKGVEKKWIEAIHHGGDCTGALVIKVKEDWQSLISELLQSEEIKI